MRRRRSLRTASATPEARCALEAGRTIQLRPDAKDTQTTALPGHAEGARRRRALMLPILSQFDLSRKVPAAISPIANSFVQVKGSLRNKNPMSRTNAVDVPPITNDDVTRRPLA